MSMEMLTYKLYDDKGYLISSSNIYLNNLTTGDKFKEDVSYINDIEPGDTYTLKFESYNR